MPPSVFISYNHKDEVWKDRLVTHLAGLVRNGRLRTWNDRDIRAGQKWLREIETAMEEARVAVLLVSPDFLASKFIQTREIPLLLERRARAGVHVVPVIVKDCLWEEEVRIADLQARPRDGKPLASYRSDKRDTELKKIAKEVLALLEDDSPAQPVAEAPSPRATTLTALHQLPPPPADFTGREADLAELRAAVKTGGVTISGVRGMGGIGKTALALKLAHELAPHYPDGQIYLDLQGVSTNPLSPIQSMGHVIRAFYPDVRLPESEAEVAALYRSALHGQRALLLLDNAAGADQVEPLIPPQGCLSLVTSRFFFHLPGFQVKDLDEMPLADARALLLRITPRIGDQADRIAEVCAGVPFALRQAAGTLSERPDLSPAAYASRLATGKAQLGLIEASLRLSYDFLPEELACRWRTLAVFPAAFDALAAAAIWSIEPDGTETALGELVLRSLVHGEDGRYRLHDLARVFAVSRLSDEELSVVGFRHAGHYRGILNHADDLFLQGGPSSFLGLRLVEIEWENIKVGQTWAAGRVANNREAAKLAASYPNVGANCLSLRLQPRERIDWIETALTAARLLNDRRREGRALGNLGLAYASLGDTRRAIEIYSQVLDITREIGDSLGEGSALNNLGNSYVALGESRRAIALYEQSLAIALDIGDRHGEGMAVGNLGNAYVALGETRYAIELFERRLDIARDLGDRRGEGNALGGLGIVYADLGEPLRAIAMYEQWLNVACDLGDRRGEANALGRLGIAYVTLGEICRAIEMHERNLAISRDIGDRRGESIACWNLGLALEKMGKLDQAAKHMKVCVDYEREVGHHHAENDAARVEALYVSIADGMTLSDSPPTPEAIAP